MIFDKKRQTKTFFYNIFSSICYKNTCFYSKVSFIILLTLSKGKNTRGEKMEKTKEKKATAEQFVEVLQELLRENVVGFIEKREDDISVPAFII